VAMQLEGKQALITGGCGSIGRTLAATFAEAGACVTVLDRADSICPQGAVLLDADLSDLAQTEAAAASAGPFDILINNAALIINKPHDEFSLQEYEDQVRVNSSAAFVLSRVCARHMKAKGWGRIINMTSLTLNGQWEGYVPYVASKGALLGLTVGLARELGAHGITVNAIAPGAVVSEAEDRVFGKRLAAYHAWVLEHQSLKVRIEPQDIANLALFLASDAARMISGQNIGVNGGW